MKLALGQINTTVGDFSGNREKMTAFAARAKSAGASLILFPELALCGYPPRDLVQKPDFLQRNCTELQRLAHDTAGIRVICGFAGAAPPDNARTATNCAAVLENGEVRFIQQKMLLPNYDVFDEARHFLPASSQQLLTLEGHSTALTICEDVWNDKEYWKKRYYQRDPAEELLRAGGSLLLNISASPYDLGKRIQRREMLRALAVKHRVPVALVNLVGGNDSLVFDGSSCVIDATGVVRAEAAAFEEDLVLFDLETNTGDMHAAIPEGIASVYHALILGTRDYVRKCGFSRVLIALSGGIDSAITAALAVEALGAENVTGVAMPGPYNSPDSLEDAAAMARQLGIQFLELPITAPFAAYLETLQPAFAGRAEDVTEENLQSRIRGTMLMALSNKYQALVLSTGNKSEMAVGYATLYGDMCGGLDVLADIPKTMVYELSHIANSRLKNAIPERVFTKAPSAELRPNQKDCDSLPAYEILDPVLKAYIEEFEAPAAIAKDLNLPPELVRDICFRVDRNEYKRQQAAPGIRVTSKAFGVGRRFPIAQKYGRDMEQTHA
jgi:NAD+ synthase/NAD+ synthase (glutamine-hydrolysing)